MLRQYQQRGQRAPHKPLLILLALGHLARDGSSEISWSIAERELADFIRAFGPPLHDRRRPESGLSFTHLRSDDVWILDHDVPMDRIRPQRDLKVVGRFAPWFAEALRDPELVAVSARQLVGD